METKFDLDHSFSDTEMDDGQEDDSPTTTPSITSIVGKLFSNILRIGKLFSNILRIGKLFSNILRIGKLFSNIL